MALAESRRPPSSHRLILIALLALGLFTAYLAGFVQDDAYISFRYAKNLIEGHGLVFNPGERVEGYTNFLWTLLISLPMRWGMDPGRASYLLGLALYPFTLFASYRLFREATGSERWSLVALLVLIANASFAGYATGGLETQLQTLLLLVCAMLTLSCARGPSLAKALTLSLAASLALLCRLDSAVALLPCYVALAVSLSRQKRIGNVLVAAALPIATLVIWSLWRHGYYGAWLPNTFYAKVSGGDRFGRGIAYWKEFAWAYGVPFVALACPFFVWRSPNLATRLSAAIGGLWALYACAVGGDFMEFRLGIAAYPFLLAVLISAVSRFGWRERYKLAIPLLLIVAATLQEQATQTYTTSESDARPRKSYPILVISTIYELRHQADDAYGFADVGRRLKSIFGSNSPVVIATTAAGAIPYYSGLRSIDIHGLTDAGIAREGRRIPEERPGHEIQATIAQLRERKVNLVIAHPQFVGVPPPKIERRAAPGFWLAYHLRKDAEYAELERTGKVVLIPLDDRAKLIALYLTPSPQVDELIAKGKWEVIPLRELVDYPSGDQKRRARGPSPK